MREVKGPHVPLTVVAAKKPGEWIIRGWLPFAKPDGIRHEIERIVGTMDLAIEWTTWTYDQPAYLIYGHGDIEGSGWPIGIYRFDYTGGDVEQGWDTYRGDPVCLAKGRGKVAEMFEMARP